MVAGVIAQLREDPIDRFTMFKRVVMFHNDEFWFRKNYHA